MPCLTLSVSDVYVLAPPRGTQSIEGCTGQGLRLSSLSAAKLVDSRILRCQTGGIMVAESAHVEMRRGMIAECWTGHPRGGGAANVFSGGHLALVDVLISRCLDTGSNGGGGISVQDGYLTMSGGAFRDCEANAGMGGGAQSRWRQRCLAEQCDRARLQSQLGRRHSCQCRPAIARGRQHQRMRRQENWGRMRPLITGRPERRSGPSGQVRSSQSEKRWRSIRQGPQHLDRLHPCG